MKQLKQSLATQKNSVISSKESAEQVFFDGVDSITFGPANCKLNFYQITGRDDETSSEIRKVILTGVIPTAALADICRNVLNNFNDNETRLKAGLAAQEQKIFKKLKNDTTKIE